MRVGSRFGLLAAADTALLTVLWPDWPALLHDLAAPTQWIERVGPDGAAGALAAAALWLTAAWLALGLCAAVVAGAPGATGRLADQLARAVLPRALYRAAAAAVGLGVVLAPVAAGAHTPGGNQPLPVPSAPSTTLPAPVLPTSPSPASAPPRPRPQSQPQPQLQPPTVGTGRQVLVRPGDSLWRIAAQHLPAGAPPARIARAWPRWYAVNRAVIGADPNRIMPGQQLHAPVRPTRTAPTPTAPTPTTQEP